VRRRLPLWPLAAGLLGAAITHHFFGGISFRGRVVLITGGSRGLGLVLARQLAREGAQLMLLARDRLELERAAAELREEGAAVRTFQGDVTDEETAARAVQATIDAYGRLDVLINNAGIIVVSPLENLTEEDFAEAFATHFWAPLRFMNAALPHLKRTRGRIVNISSIGGKIALPHLASYTASKFALAGLSDAYRAELAKDGISVTSVFPGLLRTGSHVHALFKGQQEREFAWFALGSATSFSSANSLRAARQILRACRHGTPQLVISVQARMAILGATLFPNLTARLAATMNRLLPAPGETHRAQPGLEIRAAFPPHWMTILPDRASRLNNELGESEE
jgi:NAD(P)-dependent dehydrogenase (short-subunit alcohol dehydrogenase family)